MHVPDAYWLSIRFQYCYYHHIASGAGMRGGMRRGAVADLMAVPPSGE